MKKVLFTSLILVMMVGGYKELKKQNEIEEAKIINAYVECLNNNFGQRSYCSEKVSKTSYMILDQKLEKYGYEYEVKGYDLVVVNK